MIRVGTLAAGQLTAIENVCMTWIGDGILAPSNGPCCAVIGVPLPTHAPCGDWGHGGTVGEPINARPTGLVGVCSLAASELSIKESGGVDRVRGVAPAAANGPRRAIIGVPFGSARSRRGGDDGGAISARLTSIVPRATFLLSGKPNLIAVGLVNTARHAPTPGVIGMPQGGGIFDAPGREQLARSLLVRLIIDGGDGGFGRRLETNATAQTQ